MSTNEADQALTKKQSRKDHKQAKKREKQAAKRERQKHAESNTDKLKRKQQKAEQKAEIKQAKSERAKRRILPIWLRIIIVLTLSAIALVVGLMIGYGVIGEGAPFDVLKKETWQHIIDIVSKNT